MATGVTGRFGQALDRQAKRRWERLAGRLPEMSLGELAAARQDAAELHHRLARVIHSADARLMLPHVGSNAIERPLGTDWAYRPELWRGPLARRGLSSVQTKTAVGGEAVIFHDCRHSELTYRQLRNTREEDLAPFGFRMDVFGFDGSYLSLVLHLPDSAVEGLRARHIIRVSPVVELEKRLEIFARLNVRHGPNTEQLVRELPIGAEDLSVEFDLAYSEINERRIERIWLDLIFENPQMNQITLRDLTLTRRPRAEI